MRIRDVQHPTAFTLDASVPHFDLENSAGRQGCNVWPYGSNVRALCLMCLLVSARVPFMMELTVRYMMVNPIVTLSGVLSLSCDAAQYSHLQGCALHVFLVIFFFQIQTVHEISIASEHSSELQSGAVRGNCLILVTLVPPGFE